MLKVWTNLESDSEQEHKERHPAQDDPSAGEQK